MVRAFIRVGLASAIVGLLHGPGGVTAQWLSHEYGRALRTLMPWRLTTSATAPGANAGMAAAIAHSNHWLGQQLELGLGVAQIDSARILNAEVGASWLTHSLQFDLRLGGTTDLTDRGAVLNARLAARSRNLSVHVTPSWVRGSGGVYRDTIVPGIDTIPIVRRILDRPGTPPQFFTDAEASWTSQHGRVELQAVFGGRMGLRESKPWWASAAASYRVLPIAAVGLQFGRTAPFAWRQRSSRGLTTAFLRITPGTPRTLEPTRLPAAAALSVITTPEGTRFTMTARARSVEVSGDFSNWQPVSLVRVQDDQFALLLPLEPGVYRLSVRMDGGVWKAPPGLPAIADEFGGEVGVFQVK